MGKTSLSKRRRLRANGTRRSVWWSTCALTLLIGLAAMAAETPPPASLINSNPGPTLRLDYGRGPAVSNAVAAFMYFIPLISPELVSAVTSAGNSQSARVTSARRQQSDTTFTTTCDFEFTGTGAQEDTFDLARQIKRHDRRLKSGGSLSRLLHTITVTGAGQGRIEVAGTITNGVMTANEVQFRFNLHGRSPIEIGLCDVRYVDGEFRNTNEIVARVNTLAFRRKPGPPKMEVSLASVKNKGAGNGLWQNFKGSLKGAAANLLIDPLTIEALGHRTLLDFGLALATNAPSFTFPRAKNLKATP